MSLRTSLYEAAAAGSRVLRKLRGDSDAPDTTRRVNELFNAGRDRRARDFV